MKFNLSSNFSVLTKLFKAHPWHGVKIGENAPNIVNAYIEIVPTDNIKYEIEKKSGHLRIDRPQKYSSQCPTMYGFIPQTLCSKGVGEYCSAKTNILDILGDGDPIDICILAEKPCQHGDIFARAIPIGGIRMIDRNQADDKIIAVLYEDGVYGKWENISQCPDNLLERLRHYFLTYKDMPGQERKVGLAEIYGAKEAKEVINASYKDYMEKYIEVANLLEVIEK